MITAAAPASEKLLSVSSTKRAPNWRSPPASAMRNSIAAGMTNPSSTGKPQAQPASQARSAEQGHACDTATVAGVMQSRASPQHAFAGER